MEQRGERPLVAAHPNGQEVATTTLETKERPDTTPTKPTETRDRRSLIFVLVAAIAIGLGLFGGWIIWGSTDDPDVIVVVGGSELTQRQEEMIDMLDEYGVAFLGNDAAAIIEMYAENGTMNMLSNPVLRANDGTLEEFITDFRFPDGPFYVEPVVVHENTLRFAHEYAGRTYFDIMTFTNGGELHVTSHVVTT